MYKKKKVALKKHRRNRDRMKRRVKAGKAKAKNA
jgi:hypothetical protein